MAVLFVVEDNDSIRESIVSYLKLDDHDVYEYNKLAGVMEGLSHRQADCLILDVSLPDGNGFVLAKEIRRTYSVPILFLTARDGESDRITGFEVGGDDYVVKPFSMKELMLRVRALLRRTSRIESETVLLHFILGDDNLRIETETHQVYVNEKEVYLTQAEWEVLLYLASHPGIVYSRSRLLGECLDYLAEGSERTIDTHIKNVRNKLGNGEWIETVRGYGYKFGGEAS